MKPVKGNAVVILDQKLYNSFIQEIITAASKFERLNEDPILKREVLLQLFHFLTEKKTFWTKMNMINCILLVLLLLLSMVLLKCTSFYLVVYFLNFVQLFHLWMYYDLVRFFCDLLSLVVPDDYSCKDIHFFVS